MIATPVMRPAPGERLLRYVGDRVRFTLAGAGGQLLPPGYRAVLRTNLGRAAIIRQEVIQSYAGRLPLAGASWRDIPMQFGGGEWFVELALAEVGYFRAKAYAVDGQGRQFWPEGPDVGLTVHPDGYRTANTIYCAFTRMFGGTRSAAATVDPVREAELARLDQQGYAVIPPSGKLRDLTRELPHILGGLGCRILHLLPVNPTPTTYARFGRFGSPYAAQDLRGIDPALVEFDRRTTGVDQFCELTYATHLRGGRVFLDIVINHTGWGSVLQENHPDWFVRDPDGTFVSPGAWGTTWEDLVELNHGNPASWDELAETFLVWCRRGVDGFRCDAGYKVPMHAWRYITARVRQEFPDAMFLLEGLGGSWEATETLLGDGGMQWAYSELFQNYSGKDVAWYLDYALAQSRRSGVYVHYSETHDNDRLARQGRIWSLLRNRLCGLTSVSGAFGFTCGVEWLAAEKLNVHSSRGLSWGNPDNIVAELAGLNRLLRDHPAFFEEARLTRLSDGGAAVYVLRRDSAEGRDSVLVLVNTDPAAGQTASLPAGIDREMGMPRRDLLTGRTVQPEVREDGGVLFSLGPGEAHCLAVSAEPAGLSGDAYRRARAGAALAVRALAQVCPPEAFGACECSVLAAAVDAAPERFLAALSHLKSNPTAVEVETAVREAMAGDRYGAVVTWRLEDRGRILPVPAGHWLLVRDEVPFRATLRFQGEATPLREESIAVRDGQMACFAPQGAGGDAWLELERYEPERPRVRAPLRFLHREPILASAEVVASAAAAPAYQASDPPRRPPPPLVLLTNGRGGMARLSVDLGRIQSKYDCLLGANLHPTVPVDRHVFVKRMRVWSVADGFITPLDEQSLFAFDAGPPAVWRFVANAGDGRTVEIRVVADMLEERNTTVVRFERPTGAPPLGTDLPDRCEVRLIVRIDLEDRNFHWETRRNPGAEHHFHAHTRPLAHRVGFTFSPPHERQLQVEADSGRFHPGVEWSENVPHPIEGSRGQVDRGDAFSPGWFELTLVRGRAVTLHASADPEPPSADDLRHFVERRRALQEARVRRAEVGAHDAFARQLAAAVHAFVVRRDAGRTVIAGYPWFLDWGRDSLICARGLLAAGLVDEVRQLLVTFGRFEKDGTLPNSIHGEDASNRDTSDAPLWFGVACEELVERSGAALETMAVEERGRTLADVLVSLAEGCLRGTPNGIRVDAASALVWSPAHFTWMDTNHPAGTPRAGYPVEIQVLWIRLLRQLDRLGRGRRGESWGALAERALASFNELFWLEDRGYFSDVLLAHPGQAAKESVRDNALRSNGLFAISLGLVSGDRARRTVEAALRHLVVPGALRSLAPLPVSPPLPIHGAHGGLLNDPHHPYWGRYEGDEDTRRKPAYHNGTAWTWTFPTFCEALACAWDFEPAAVAAARAYLGSMERLLNEGCLGHLPEIVDGDAPHAQRGCDAQAWSVTEALRVWQLLGAKGA